MFLHFPPSLIYAHINLSILSNLLSRRLTMLPLFSLHPEMGFDTRNQTTDLSCPSQCFQGCLMCQCQQQKMSLFLLSSSCMFKHSSPLWIRILSIRSHIRGLTQQVSASNLHSFLTQKLALPTETEGVRGLHGKGYYSWKRVCLLCLSQL